MIRRPRLERGGPLLRSHGLLRCRENHPFNHRQEIVFQRHSGSLRLRQKSCFYFGLEVRPPSVYDFNP